MHDYSTWEGILWAEGAENRVQSIDIGYTWLFGMLDLSGFTALDYLNIAGNFISEIDLTGCESLIYLNCFNNILESLTVPSAEIISAGFNQLTSLDISGADNLSELYVGANSLASLDLSHNAMLTSLDCNENDLSF